MKCKITKLIMIVGLLLVIGSLSLKVHSKIQENKAIKSFESKISTNKESDLSDIKLGEEIALINIPSINLDTVVVNGIKKEYLNYYVCRFENSVMPGDIGNFSLAGHSSYIYNEVFNDLHKVKVNDKIIIKTVSSEFEYTITEILEVSPDSVDVLEQNMNKREITIVTCTDSGKNRLIVKGEIK